MKLRLLLLAILSIVVGFCIAQLRAPIQLWPSSSSRGEQMPSIPAARIAMCTQAVALQSAPDKLAALGKRQANPRLSQIMYWLAEARDVGGDPGTVIDHAQAENGSAGTPRAPLVKAALLRNLKICDELGISASASRLELRWGNAPIVREGPGAGRAVQTRNIVPYVVAPELGNELANLELLPAATGREKGDKVGQREVELARQFNRAGLLPDAKLAALEEMVGR